MSQFPTALPDFDDLDPQATLAVNNHAARHNIVHEELLALAGKVGIDGSADTNSLDFKVAGLRTDVDDVIDDVATLFSDKADSSAVASAISAAIASAKQALYPVGSIYINSSDNTNPGTLLGFGTWSAFGAGRVPVGFDSGQTEFDTAEETGGAKTHTLTIAEMPAHSHPISQSGYSGGGNQTAVGTNPVAYPNNSNTNNTGGGGAHNNLQPYIVVYMWKRTA